MRTRCQRQGILIPAEHWAVALLLVANVLLAATNFLGPPEVRPRVDVDLDPFVGPRRVAAWIGPSDTPWTHIERIRAHRSWLLLTALSILSLSVGLHRYRDRLPPIRIAPLPSFRLILNSKRIARGLRALSLPVAATAAATCIAFAVASLRMVPDFSLYDASQLHVLLNHYELLASADHVAVGDRLLIDVKPSYGLLWPLLCGAYQRFFGLIPLGSIMKILMVTNALGLLLLLSLYYLFARGRFWCWGPPFLLAARFYQPAWEFLVPPNHCLIRSGGLIITVGVWYLSTSMSSRLGGLCLGACTAFAILNNFETGVAAAVGTAAVLYFRNTKELLRQPWHAGWRIASSFATGFFGLLASVELFAVVLLGQFIPPSGLILPSGFASAGAGGLLIYPGDQEVFRLIIFMSVHAALVQMHIATLSEVVSRNSVRAGICTALLVWMAYPVNRPSHEYLYSVYVLYGFLLVDALRCVVQLPVLSRVPQHATRFLTAGFTVLLFLAMYRTVTHGRTWRIDSWSAPLVAPDAHTATVSGVLLEDALIKAELQRSGFIAAQAVARGRRIVYISTNGTLLSRLANTVASQAYAEPGICINESIYHQFLHQVLDQSEGEFYIDTRCTRESIWYGFVFDKMRQDVSPWFHLVDVQSGWEIWRHREDAPPLPDAWK